ncbi:anti-ECF sigma factor ChrR [Shewanella sairae]|uniref:Anti-ECF sigma factor ChrR n=1 Tax=Shewanella sairae TaxID=190310 RepID=A0ABQ4PHX0_9GAMM|nr:ChrR family anti-sigma-E factor [Shewanella sairae]MCL1131311.1 ChrR family anti-sigma-E factor [Shewanella sairae]GIU47023.1 anti-ECF sigma factor ChrR [Shewanella sairae]
MIKFHPKDEMLAQHVNGQLHLALATAVSAHCELCAICREKVAKITEQQAQSSFNTDLHVADNDYASIDFSAMLNQITSLDAVQTEATVNSRALVQIKGKQYTLPRAFAKQANQSWSGFGKISRMRLDADEGHARASLLHIDANGEIPEHTHTGREITLLLEGHFEDEFSRYVPGDFIELDADHQHSPKTLDGCLCYTVVDAALHFTKGISKILNPIGELIY